MPSEWDLWLHASATLTWLLEYLTTSQASEYDIFQLEQALVPESPKGTWSHHEVWHLQAIFLGTDVETELTWLALLICNDWLTDLTSLHTHTCTHPHPHALTHTTQTVTYTHTLDGVQARAKKRTCKNWALASSLSFCLRSSLSVGGAL